MAPPFGSSSTWNTCRRVSGEVRTAKLLYLALTSRVLERPVSVAVKGPSSGGKTYLSTSATFTHGQRYFRWVPPRLKAERTYTYTLHARDLAGNSSSSEGELRVQGAPSKKAR